MQESLSGDAKKLGSVMKLPIKIKLPEHFLEKEVRCGYSVTEKAKKIWAVELDLLAEFDRVCRKHDINYQIFAGTLLGAVRHEGFSPWDDDVDVCLLRGDYEKLYGKHQTVPLH